jgi:hypothetical protein
MHIIFNLNDPTCSADRGRSDSERGKARGELGRRSRSIKYYQIKDVQEKDGKSIESSFFDENMKLLQ